MSDTLQAIGNDYCNSDLTVREIAAKHNLSPGRICQLAKEQGWPARSLNVSGSEPTEEATEVADRDPEPASSADDDLSDAELDRGAKIELTRAQAEDMPVSMRELAVRVSVAEADAHPDYREAIAALKTRRREAILQHRRSVAENVAAIEAGKRAVERIEALGRERHALEANHSPLAVAFAMGKCDAPALADHRRAVEYVDDRLAALKTAVPLLELEAQRVLRRNERFARDPDDIHRELAELRADVACRIARARW